MSSRHWRITPGVLTSDLGEESALMHKERGLYFGLDEVGTTIWNLLERGASSEEVVQGVLDEYEVERETAEADVSKFLGELEALDLVQRLPS